MARCIACGGPLGQPRRFGVVALARCAACGSQTALPRPARAEQAALHDSDAYWEKTYFEGRRGRDDAAERRFRRLLRILPQRELTGRRLLDVGCDTGEFAAASARIAGVVPLGVDVSRRALEAAHARGVETFHGELAESPFDDVAVLTAIDVLEHVADPLDFLHAAGHRLAADGVVYVETPNWRSPIYAIGRVFPHARLFPPEHVQYFTAAGMRRLAERAGLGLRALFTRRMDPVAGSPLLRVALEALQPPRAELLLCALLEAA